MPLRPDLPPTTPVGVRDLPPSETAIFVALETALTDTFSEWGYQRVITPAFELAHVLELGLGPASSRKLLRFVDPQNGEVLALRSDITPQIARLVCGGPMRDVEPPIRLCYFGRVFRLRQHSEFQRREVAQAGVELIGPDDAESDVEILRLCDAALAAAGGTGRRLSIGHAGLVNAAFADLDLSDEQQGQLANLLHRKDAAGLASTAAECGLGQRRTTVLTTLCGLFGRADAVLDRAQGLIDALPAARPFIERLAQVADGLRQTGVLQRCLLDLGETLGFGYYTGVVFHAYLPGVGQAVASGGRYDTLLSRYGRNLPAAGFAIDEEGLSGEEAWVRS